MGRHIHCIPDIILDRTTSEHLNGLKRMRSAAFTISKNGASRSHDMCIHMRTRNLVYVLKKYWYMIFQICSENKLAIYNKFSATQLIHRNLQSPLFPSLSFLSSHFLSLHAFNCPITRFPRVQDVVRPVGKPVSNESRLASPKHFCNDAESLNNKGVYPRRMTFLD